MFIKRAYQNTFNYSGKTGRKDFWLWTLVASYPLLYSSWPLLGNSWGAYFSWRTPLFLVIFIGVLLPSISIMVRRLRDAGFPPLLVLLVWVAVGWERLMFSTQSGTSNFGYWVLSAFFLLIVTMLFLGLWAAPSRHKEQS